MRLTRTSIVLAVLGVLAIIAAVVVRVVVVPSVTKLPDDLNTTQSYAGTYSGLNPAALAGTGGQLLLRNVPMTASRTYTVDSSTGDTAVVKQTIARAIGGQPDPKAETRYAVDRTNFESVPAPSGSTGVVKSQGLIFTLPLKPSTDASYRLWDQPTAASYPLTYQKTSTLEGRTVLQYTSFAEGALANPAALGLPTSVTARQLRALQPVLANVLPSRLLAQLPAILTQLPASIPLSYTSSTTSTVYADSELGVPIKTGSTQKISARLPLGTSLAVPFATITLTATDASVKALADDTAAKADTLNLVGTVVPIVLGVLGILLLIGALLAARRGTSGGGTSTPPAQQATRSMSA